MNRSFTMKLFTIVLLAAATSLFSVSVPAQIPGEIETLAGRTAERVAKTHQLHIFISGLEECQLDPDLCMRFETSLRADIEKQVPGVHFVRRESVINILEGRGFLAFDVYIPDVLKAVATQAGADILVTDTLLWQRDGYEMSSEVFDANRGRRLDQFRVKLERPVPGSGDDPLVFTDPATQVSLIIPRGKQSGPTTVVGPVCEKCPDPAYTPEAKASGIQGRVLLLLTVSEQGAAENIGVIDGLEYGLTDQALEAVRSWQFKPAIGRDGKPFATRVPIEVTFRLK